MHEIVNPIISIFFRYFLPANLSAQSRADKIRLNQIGFYPDGLKKAVVVYAPSMYLFVDLLSGRFFLIEKL